MMLTKATNVAPRDQQLLFLKLPSVQGPLLPYYCICKIINYASYQTHDNIHFCTMFVCILQSM